MTEQPEETGLARLKSIRNQRAAAGGKTTSRGRPANRPASGGKPASKAKTATVGEQAAATLKGVGVIIGMRWHVQGAILTTQADTIGRELDDLAAADKHVRELLERVFNSTGGKTGAYLKFALAVAPTAAALAYVSGVQHPVAAALGAPVIEGAVLDVATRIASQEAQAASTDGTWSPDPDRVAEIAAQLLAPPAPPAQEGATP